MGRHDFRPLRVHQTASQLFASERIKNVPSWHSVLSSIPPAQTLVRTQPLQHHQERPPPPQQVQGQQQQRLRNTTKPKRRKASKLFQPQRIVYEEDQLRREFYGDHPWELARPRVVLENDGRDAEKKDWSLATQPDRPIDGESVIQRQVHILHHSQPSQNQSPHTDTPMTPAKAYDIARKEFYEMRLQQDVERRVAKEEAMATGAYFGKSVLQVGMEQEDKMFEEWKAWAEAQVVDQEQRRAAMYTGVDSAEGAMPEEEGEVDAMLGELEGSIPAKGQEALGGAAVRP
ncbi:MAG: hypothetical protein Q9220_004005 [cf. Caloplaca sp. 1 TL-2023]